MDKRLVRFEVTVAVDERGLERRDDTQLVGNEADDASDGGTKND